MAVLPPPPAPVAPGFTPVPPAKRSGCAGCGFGCLGCVGVFVALVLLMVGGAWFFLVVQAQASVPAPAALVVYAAPVDVGRNDSGYRLVVNSALTQIYLSGEIDPIFNKWLGKLGRPSGLLAATYVLNSIPE